MIGPARVMSHATSALAVSPSTWSDQSDRGYRTDERKRKDAIEREIRPAVASRPLAGSSHARHGFNLKRRLRVSDVR